MSFQYVKANAIDCPNINQDSTNPTTNVSGVVIGVNQPSTLVTGHYIDLDPAAPLNEIIMCDQTNRQLIIGSGLAGTYDTNLAITNNSTSSMKQININCVHGSLILRGANGVNFISRTAGMTFNIAGDTGNTGYLLTNVGGGSTVWSQANDIGWSTTIPWSQWAMTVSGDFNDTVYHGTATPSINQDLGTVNLSIPAAGQYIINYWLYKSADAGIVEVYVNGILFETVDMYDAALSSTIEKNTASDFAQGTNSIQFIMNGKNAGSSNYYFNSILPGVILYRVS